MVSQRRQKTQGVKLLRTDCGLGSWAGAKLTLLAFVLWLFSESSDYKQFWMVFPNPFFPINTFIFSVQFWWAQGIKAWMFLWVFNLEVFQSKSSHLCDQPGVGFGLYPSVQKFKILFRISNNSQGLNISHCCLWHSLWFPYITGYLSLSCLVSLSHTCSAPIGTQPFTHTLTRNRLRVSYLCAGWLYWRCVCKRRKLGHSLYLKHIASLS